MAAGLLAGRSASAASWRSSGASACGTTSRAASRSTRRSPTTCSSPSSGRAAPLHDGAVIIQGERIAAAACFLPLTVNPQVSKDFGTRHRAAIGLTEETDAVTVIVSEETGRISLALDGGIESGLTGDTLRSAPARAADAQASDTGIAGDCRTGRIE